MCMVGVGLCMSMEQQEVTQQKKFSKHSRLSLCLCEDHQSHHVLQTVRTCCNVLTLSKSNMFAKCTLKSFPYIPLSKKPSSP